MSTTKKQNLLHIEFLRIIATFFVVFNHTEDKGFFRFAYIVDDPVRQWIYLGLSIGCKVGVPLFFMMSGALLLKKQESIQVVYKKRILKYCIVLVAISYFYWWHAVRIFGTHNALYDSFIQEMLFETTSFHLWYLYAYLGLMMILPLLRKLVKDLDYQEWFYWGSMSLLSVGIVPILEYVLLRGNAHLNGDLKNALFVNTNIVFFCMGYFIEHKFPRKYLNIKTITLGCLVSAVAIFICGYLTLYRGSIMGELHEWKSQMFYNCFIAIPAYTIYIAAKLFFERVSIPQWCTKLITGFGSTTFGIYLFHIAVRDETHKVFSFFNQYIGVMPAVLLWVVYIMVVSSIITAILKRIPIIKNYL